MAEYIETYPASVCRGVPVYIDKDWTTEETLDLIIDWGDGTVTEYHDLHFPYPPIDPHTYDHDGPFTITMTTIIPEPVPDTKPFVVYYVSYSSPRTVNMFSANGAPFLYPLLIDWGDGTISEYNGSLISHYYSGYWWSYEIHVYPADPSVDSNWFNVHPTPSAILDGARIYNSSWFKAASGYGGGLTSIFSGYSYLTFVDEVNPESVWDLGGAEVSVYQNGSYYCSEICYNDNALSYVKITVPEIINYTLITPPTYYVFFNWFYKCTSLTDASNITINIPFLDNSGSTITYFCNELFSYCTALTIPTKPTIIRNKVLSHKFDNGKYRDCTSLLVTEDPVDCTGVTVGVEFQGGKYTGCASLTAPEVLYNLEDIIAAGGGFESSKYSYCTSLLVTEDISFYPAQIAYNSLCLGKYSYCTSLTAVEACSYDQTVLGVNAFNGYKYSYCTSITVPEMGIVFTSTNGSYDYFEYYKYFNCSSLTQRDDRSVPSGATRAYRFEYRKYTGTPVQ